MENRQALPLPFCTNLNLQMFKQKSFEDLMKNVKDSEILSLILNDYNFDRKLEQLTPEKLLLGQPPSQAIWVS